MCIRDRLLRCAEAGDVLDVGVVHADAVPGLHEPIPLGQQVEHRNAAVQPVLHAPGNRASFLGMLGRDPTQDRCAERGR
eukprot:13101224-Alexandrium_andersonii.AAC.1